MIFLFIILPVLLIASVFSLVLRVVFGGFRSRGLSRRSGNWINGTGYGGGFGYGRQRRGGLGGSLLSILAFVALERLFTRRW